MAKVHLLLMYTQVLKPDTITTFDEIGSERYFDKEAYQKRLMLDSLGEAETVIVYTMPFNTLVENVLKRDEVKNMFVSALEAQYSKPLNIKIRLSPLYGQLLGFARFAQDIHAKVNSCVNLRGSAVIADIQ